jgi:hypothetical protein
MPNYNQIAGGLDPADNLAVGQNPAFINVSKGMLELWANDVAENCKNPTVASVNDSRIFKQLNNTGVYRLDWVELTGMGDWGVKAEKQNVIKGAPSLSNERSYCPAFFYKDLPVTDKMRMMNNSSSIISASIKKFIKAARRTDEKAGFSLITNAPYSLAENNLVQITAATAGAVTIAEWEKLVEAGAQALMIQEDADGNPVECFDPTLVLTNRRDFMALSKALNLRTDGCCSVNNQQYSGIAGLRMQINVYAEGNENFLLNSTSTLYRDIVYPLTVVYRDHMYNDNWEAFYRGKFVHRYFQADKLGLVKMEVTNY